MLLVRSNRLTKAQLCRRLWGWAWSVDGGRTTREVGKPCLESGRKKVTKLLAASTAV